MKFLRINLICNAYKGFLVILPYLISLIVVSCSNDDDVSNPDHDECTACNQSTSMDTISDQRFQLLGVHYDDFLVKERVRDGRLFRFCDSVYHFDGFEDEKVLDITGTVFLTCSDSLTDGSIQIDHYEIINHCPEPYDTLIGNFSLVGEKWRLIQLVGNGDTTLYPCEAIPPSLTIRESQHGVFIDVGLGRNGIQLVPTHRDSLIKIGTEYIHLPDFEIETTFIHPPTQALVNFESAYQSFFECGSFPCKLQYQIIDNFLTLRNAQSGKMAEYYRDF